jgi:hypothetical protein
MHLPPALALSSLGSDLTGVTRSMSSISRVLRSSARHRDMSLVLKTRAADVGTVRAKKVRSSTLIARLMGGVAMSVTDMDLGGRARDVSFRFVLFCIRFVGRGEDGLGKVFCVTQLRTKSRERRASMMLE